VFRNGRLLLAGGKGARNYDQIKREIGKRFFQAKQADGKGEKICNLFGLRECGC